MEKGRIDSGGGSVLVIDAPLWSRRDETTASTAIGVARRSLRKCSFQVPAGLSRRSLSKRADSLGPSMFSKIALTFSIRSLGGVPDSPTAS
jgi:hypothetical protein